jgi:hypothetical protein
MLVGWSSVLILGGRQYQLGTTINSSGPVPISFRQTDSDESNLTRSQLQALLPGLLRTAGYVVAYGDGTVNKIVSRWKKRKKGQVIFSEITMHHVDKSMHS